MEMRDCWGWVLLHCLTLDGLVQWVLQESRVTVVTGDSRYAEWWIFETKMKDEGFEKAILRK